MNQRKEHYDVIVVGGGASGMMAAGRAAEEGRRVLLLEKNDELGKKLKITGGGRCNVTNAETDIHKLLDNYGAAKNFLFSPFSKFGVKETFSFFEKRNLPLIIEARNRVFPATERAMDVFNVLLNYLKTGKVEIRLNAAVEKVLSENKKITAVVVAGEKLRADSFIFATGGKSHPETGSTGDGFIWLKELGHSVAEPTPTIVPVAVKEEWIKKLAGVSLRNVRISFFVNGQKKFTRDGDILCTHFGLSGPLILNSANLIKDLLEEGEVTAKIDTHPNLDLGALDRKITAVFDENKNKTLKNVFNKIGPTGASAAILSLFPAELAETKINNITADERKQIAETLKSLPVTITRLMGYERAVVTDGGVTLEEIDTRTMRSKLYKNLYLTGDLLDIRRPSGGFSLQLCWTTGFVAGSSLDI